MGEMKDKGYFRYWGKAEKDGSTVLNKYNMTEEMV